MPVWGRVERAREERGGEEVEGVAGGMGREVEGAVHRTHDDAMCYCCSHLVKCVSDDLNVDFVQVLF